MVVGFAVDGRADRVIGIDVTARPADTRAQIKRIAEHTADLVGLGRGITDADIVLEERYAYPAYGLPSAETLDAIRLCARLEGMLTDPVYEGEVDAGDARHGPTRYVLGGVEGALCSSRRRARAGRLQLSIPQWLAKPLNEAEQCV
jgi:1-aminocyclopropane-1-carboxylate deaminase